MRTEERRVKCMSLHKFELEIILHRGEGVILYSVCRKERRSRVTHRFFFLFEPLNSKFGIVEYWCDGAVCLKFKHVIPFLTE